VHAALHTLSQPPVSFLGPLGARLSATCPLPSTMLHEVKVVLLPRGATWDSTKTLKPWRWYSATAPESWVVSITRLPRGASSSSRVIRALAMPWRCGRRVGQRRKGVHMVWAAPPWDTQLPAGRAS
jgi:hypothetical protein